MKYSKEVKDNNHSKSHLLRMCERAARTEFEMNRTKTGDEIVYWTNSLPPKLICTARFDESGYHVDDSECQLIG